MSQEQVKITVPQILGYLDKGMKRQDIAEELGLNMSDVKRIFEHPELRGKQAKKKPGFIFTDSPGLPVEEIEEGENNNLDNTYTGDASEEFHEEAETVEV